MVYDVSDVSYPLDTAQVVFEGILEMELDQEYHIGKVPNEITRLGGFAITLYLFFIQADEQDSNID